MHSVQGVHGSPPHMRGKAPPPFLSRLLLRITPAHAGKRKKRRKKTENWKDHPRTCGEKNVHPALIPSFCGSPPHMRGKVSFSSCCTDTERITPAHAGKRRIHRMRLPHERDHPRTCGEKVTRDERYVQLKGSPPHMRGKVLKL